ncbi:FISUMP domain-containing protein [Elizabethkingia sp. HX QKY]|uniref:FISUMP domain-containing protein n=1 Tax=Elizabethkingia TaxID=308865 RepID=UPI002A24AF97|nr:FISUMP domain-containing protein [Elizabethkingia sp. HX QKY]MDX8572362.1 FISUMP domain-containing protein [Elizabethkingia sp. HX QKY]
MKKELQLIRGIVLLSVLLMSSCRSTDSENTLTGSGSLAVSFNLVGAEYAYPGKLPSQASLGKRNMSNSENKIQRHSVLVTPSSLITAELSPSLDHVGSSASASLDIKPIAAVSGDPLASGMKFRVIAYRNNGNYHTHQDYTVGQTAIPMMLDNGAAYNFVVYSYGTTSLPSISSREQNNISSASVNYDDNNRDFMYEKIPFTPTNSINTLNITLRHKVSQITTIVNSGSLGNITNITGGILTPHYSNGIVSLSSGAMSGRTTLSSGAILAFSGLNTSTITSTPVFVNADTGGNATGGFSADITIAGATKTISLPNSFKVTPENKSNLTINLMKCGAYVDPVNYKEFMCHNLGADMSADPFTPSAAIHGAKYQWGAQTGEAGRYISQSDDQTNSGAISGWYTTAKPNGPWSDTSKTANDPCPDGYRVPTEAQWQGVLMNNNVEKVGSWANDGNYTTALYFRNPSNVRTLMLPAAGNRHYTDGALNSRGSSGGYWSSNGATQTARELSIIDRITDLEVKMFYMYQTVGNSVRCIAE